MADRHGSSHGPGAISKPRKPRRRKFMLAAVAISFTKRGLMQTFSDSAGNAWKIDFSIPGRLDFVAGIGREIRDNPQGVAERLRDGDRLADMVCLLATGPRQLHARLREEIIENESTRNAAAGALLDAVAAFAPGDAKLQRGVNAARQGLPVESLTAVPPARGTVRM